MKTSVENQKQLSAVIIDSHVLMRQILASMLRQVESVDNIESLSATTGMPLLSGFQENEPDIIFLGINSFDSAEMQLFAEIRRSYPHIPVILITNLNKDGARIALHGLKEGAVDYITKPDRDIGLVLANKHFYKRVLPLLSYLPHLNLELLKKSKPVSVSELEVMKVISDRSKQISNHVEVVVIGACLGGVRSLYQLISALPEKIHVPVIIVQHMPKIYTRELADDLDRITPLNVREAQNNSSLLPGQIYLAPGGYHTVVKSEGARKSLFIHRGPRENHNRPSIDVLFRSAVQAYSDKVLGVFLSGGGNDGVLGANYITDAGGEVIIESEKSSLLWQLPEKIQNNITKPSSFNADRIGVEIAKRIYSPSKRKMVSTSQLKKRN
jgi:two-component system, chemotaxis family, protein-glutamate methylesterase/glutaminase